MRKVNMRDVSTKTGFSTATISRAINNKGYVQAKTRKRIIKAIKELGYYPPIKSLVGLIVPDSSNPFFSQLGFTFERRFAEIGFHLLISSSEGRVDREVELIEQMLRLQVKGLIFITAGNDTESVVKLIAEPSVPVVLFDRHVGGSNMDFVTVDSKEGTQSAVDYLVTLGHTRIAHVQGPLETQTGMDRYKAFCKAMEFHGLTVADWHIVQGDFQLSGGLEAAEKLRALPVNKRPTAIMAGNDLMAIGAIRYLMEKGVRIPDEVSVIGFDNIEFAEWIHPRLTTIAQPVSQMVTEAVRLLDKRIRELGTNKKRRHAPKPLILNPRLVIRDSTGPCKSQKGERRE